VEALEAELATQRELNARPSAVVQGKGAAPPSADDASISRRRLLGKLGGAALAGAGIAAAGTALSPSVAGATTLSGDGGTTDDGVAGTAHNSAKAGVLGRNTTVGPGVHGHSDVDGGTAILGDVPQSGIGVSGVTGSDLGIGVLGQAGATNGLVLYGAGVLGDSQFGWGVVGASGHAFFSGVYGVTTKKSGHGVAAENQAGGPQLLLLGRPDSGPPTGYHSAGGVCLDGDGVVWVCTAEGDPATWQRITYGPAYQLLSKSIRLYDTRADQTAPYPVPRDRGKLNPSMTSGYDLQVAGSPVGGVEVPDNATAVIGTLSVTGTGAPPGSGYLTVFPTGFPPNPVTTDISWSLANQTLSTQIVCKLFNGKMTIQNGRAGGSAPTDVVFDAKGFIA
jgi:hypothetical protein